MKSLAEELGTVPRTVDMARHGDHDPVVYHEEFGSWEGALKEAGLDPDGISAPEGSSGKRGARTKEGGQKSGTEVGKKEAGNDSEGYTHIAEARSEPTSAQEGLLEDIKLFHETYSRAPTRQDVEETIWMPSHEEYEKAFGTVADASREAGVTEDSHHEANKTSDADAKDLIEEVKKYESLYGEVPTVEEIDAKFWTHTASAYLEEFGDWNTVIQKAGLTPDR